MQHDLNNFDLSYQDTLVRITRHDIQGQTVYRVIFADKRQPLILHRALNAVAEYFWTSIPQGRKTEAEAIGRLIENYTRQNSQ
jgi:hypothetical protein